MLLTRYGTFAAVSEPGKLTAQPMGVTGASSTPFV